MSIVSCGRVVTRIFCGVLGDRFLDKDVDDIVLDRVHDDREQKHHEEDLNSGVPFSPLQGPITDFDDEG